MRRPTNIQIIEQGGIPAFAVIPYADFIAMFPEKEDITIPHDVVGIIAKEGCNLLRAWRKYLRLTQKDKNLGRSHLARNKRQRKDLKIEKRVNLLTIV